MTTIACFSFTAIKSDGSTFSSIEKIYPYYSVDLQLEEVNADAGNFDTGISLDGPDADGGEFDLGISISFQSLYGGDFDLGTAGGDPFSNPSGTPDGNGSADPEIDYGINLIDDQYTIVQTSNLPSTQGDKLGLIPVELKVFAAHSTRITFFAEIKPFIGWNYGSVYIDTGYSIDMGTFSDPFGLSLDFGGFDSEANPTIPSGVY